ncbi:MAG: hypothetical protein AAGF12_32760 [Myxococcota bacterium]
MADPLEDDFELALRGEFKPVLARRGAAEKRERLTIDSLVALASGHPPPNPTAMYEHRAVRGLPPRALSAFLALDREALDTVVRAQVALDGPAVVGTRWLQLFDGDLPSGSAPKDAVGRIEYSVQEALFAIEEGSIADAVQTARRAMRMARTEQLVFSEYLAALALARARRYQGRPHLALRILGSLDRVLPRPWHGWLGWEQALAGIEVGRDGWGATMALRSMLSAASDGSRAELERHMGTAIDFAPIRRERDALIEVLDWSREVARRTKPWVRGTTLEPPGPIVGLTVPSVESDGLERAGVLIVVAGKVRRRILRAGAALVPNASIAVDSYALNQRRPLELLAVVACAGLDGIAEEELFREIYGFQFQKSQHGGLFRTLVHRARAALPEGAALERRDGRMVVESSVPIVLPDPRCVVSLEALILRALAERGGQASSREIAEVLGVSARTVQLTLRGLIDEGVCDTVGRGRGATYVLEDTTFSQPTLSRLAVRGLQDAQSH